MLILFRPQTFYRICNGCLYGLETYGQESDTDGCKTCYQKYPPFDFDPVGKILEPVVH